MTKKLSKQLCDICDIPFERHIDNYRVVDNDGDVCEQYVEILDFGKPENFVKLFKLITTLEDCDFDTGLCYMSHIPSYQQLSCLLVARNMYHSENPDPIKAFIECVIKCVKDDNDMVDYIKEQEWSYE